MTLFDASYAGLYDLFHQSKDYENEVIKIIKVCDTELGLRGKLRILDFGCGTGRHANALAKNGTEVLGYDRSEAMLRIAKNRYPHIFFSSNLTDFPGGIDLSISMFDVISYQTNLEELLQMLEEIKKVQGGQGYLIADCWNLNGVINDPPKQNVRTVNIDDEIFERTVNPIISENKDQSLEKNGVVTLKIDVNNKSKSQKISSEIHEIKAWSKTEIQTAVKLLGNCQVNFVSASDYSLPLNELDWRMGLIFKW